MYKIILDVASYLLESSCTISVDLRPFYTYTSTGRPTPCGTPLHNCCGFLLSIKMLTWIISSCSSELNWLACYDFTGSYFSVGVSTTLGQISILFSVTLFS